MTDSGPTTDGISGLSTAGSPAAAESYAKRGFRVVPLHSVVDGVCSCERGADCNGAGKHPRIKAWQENASSDRTKVLEWFRRWPRANVGLAMGGPERLVALDVDGAEGRASLAKLELLYFPLPETLTSRSGRPDGGEHRIFRLAAHHDLDAIKNNAGRIGMKRGAKKTDPRPFPALDIRGDGGQIVVCPSIHKSGHPYVWTNEAPIAQLPEWFYKILVPPAEPAPEPAPMSLSPAVAQHDAHEKYAAVALDRACDEVRTAPKGTRNDTINREAYSIGTLVGAGLVRHDDAEARLLEAMRTGGWDGAAIRTLHSATLRRALNDGARNPRVIPELPARTMQPYRGALPALKLEPQDRWTALEVLVDELAQVPSDARAERALERGFLDGALAVVDDDQSSEFLRLIERLKGLGIKANSWKMAFRSRRKEQLEVRVAAAPPPENEDAPRKRTITVHPGMLGDLVRQSLTLLRDDPNVFVRDGELVTVLGADGPSAPKIQLLKSDTVRVWLADSARWVLPSDTGIPTLTDPPVPVVAGVCADPFKKDIRRLDGVVEAPTLGPSGELVESDGYHEAARLVLVPSRSFPRVPDAPTRDDAREALKQLREPFAQFDYESEVDRSIPLAAVLSIVARSAIRGPVPAFVLSANTKGSGKTLQAKCIIGCALGRPIEDAGWRDDEKELSSRLDTYALEGAQYVFFDELRSQFGGGPLAAYLTSTNVSPRVLGQSKRVSCPWRAVMLATGNNVQLGRDMDRRAIMSKLLSRYEKPWFRPDTDFAHHPLDAWVIEQHPRLLVAALTIVRAWILANRPRGSCPTYGSFESWSRFVPDALEWAGAENPLQRALDADDANETDDDRALRIVLTDLRRLDPGGAGLKTTEIVNLLYPSGRPPRAGDGPPDGFDDLREALESVVRGRGPGGAPLPALVGKWFARLEHRTMGGVWLHQQTSHGKVSRWRVVEVPVASDDLDADERAAIASL